jgi:hypothetical protein
MGKLTTLKGQGDKGPYAYNYTHKQFFEPVYSNKRKLLKQKKKKRRKEEVEKTPQSSALKGLKQQKENPNNN